MKMASRYVCLQMQAKAIRQTRRQADKAISNGSNTFCKNVLIRCFFFYWFNVTSMDSIVLGG
ncbi:hypothetical protein SA22_2156 [Salmonella enterica subsp. enterica serovar Agona str. 22.H.04]|uniref:Uncharacterized protein n=1 Tax=Salmonella agona (strain SL483) TaxID=454166 RepID=B5F3N5_SALA4|nr:hypothetical protein SeAg_B1273 [Salmonella enterica subsp. enterica serovar Agona str. SL483]CAH2826429.1 hypothetical protein SEN47SA97_01610 [Salmonella enterica subsp. enterica serovar Agona]CCR01100.1 hypothetical protein SA73_2320 [Salmonella enterica subsp. enterica serovar Agona str. 73.H.09]CCR03562.1 hypothetical protein SA72_0107 [Salmonella enterica subsp. enterica serovar Agona str. 72.A.52]CCR10223.1 hypothetical protein SA71_2201 [Salmonella enterica subsp. enterica serovar Ag